MKILSNFEKKGQELLDKYKVPGSVVAIAQDGQIVYEKAFGYKNAEKGQAPDTDTVFGLASVTKSFTCVAIMQLAEKGKLHIHAPVISYLPEFSIEDKEELEGITVHHFMTHSSGLPPLPSLDYAMSRKRNDDALDLLEITDEEYPELNTSEQLMDFINELNVELFSTPGELFSYSNDAFALLGAIVARVSGIPYEQYVVDHILKPCGMSHTYFTIEEYGDYENITTCYEQQEADGKSQIYAVLDWWDAPSMRATGFLKSTAGDMLKYTQIYVNKGVVNGNRILSEESVEQMLTPHIKMDPERYYGYGLGIVQDYFGNKLVEHGGSLPSISSKLGMIPEEGVSVIVLTNLMGFPASKMMEIALNDYFGRDIDASPFFYEEYTVDFETLQSYQGKYASDEGMDVTLSLENEKVTFQYKGDEYPIKFVRKNVFIAYMDDVKEPIEILIDDKGQPNAVSIFHRIVPKVKLMQQN